jgi:signal transduction histidine kinase
MIEGVAFQTRARTIDHLGRGQIADAPTAVSELWKNAYDAYAKNVALHIFDGSPEVAAIFDDGIGLSRKDVLERWLVIGTESKFDEPDATPTDTLGLPVRPRQGEKGIGRLSVAFLAPGTILISKRANSEFVAILVDWRLFENPYLALQDIELPVQTFSSTEALADGLPTLLNALKSNLGGEGSDREKKLASSWKRFSDYETKHGASSTAEAIAASWKTLPLTRRHLEEWPVFLKLADHGTAIFMVGLNNELGVWVRPDEAGEEVEEARERLTQTLTGFTDPYSKSRPTFDYEVFIHRGDDDRRLLGATEVFGLEGFNDLEHSIDGEFDARGTFTGRIVAFGQDLGTKVFYPARPLSTKGRDRLGPFSFAIGTFEVDERRSTLDPNQHAFLDGQAEKYAGVLVYRDFLRVMPYGRPDSDFLRMEERRSKHAGREFWAHRRSFGRIGFTRGANPALRDKAGREGLVDNRAFREMRILVIEFLMDAARKYFGTDAALRNELMPGIMERKALQKEAADKARARRRRGIRQFIKEQSAPLTDAIARANSLIGLAKDTLSKRDTIQATVLAARVRDIRLVSDALRPPTPPSRLGELEVDWRKYRDDFEVFSGKLQDLASLAAEVDASLQADKPHDALQNHYLEQRKVLIDQLLAFSIAIDDRLLKLKQKWTDQGRADEAEIENRIGHLLTAKVNASNLLGMLNLLDANRVELSEIFAGRYHAVIGALDQLIEGIDLQGAVDITNERQEELEEQLRDIQAVAQIGITVEIIGHEFETLESEVKRNLGKLPLAARQTEQFERALRSHQALADRLRFLSPLKIGGYRSRETITGQQISNYVSEFFSSMLKDQRIDFLATMAFRKIAITDIPSRIYPTFINLVNNAIYWTAQSNERKVQIDFKDGLAIIADTGPGVDPEDIPRLFNIFFTKRRSGRGVGLYLSRVNLSVAGHKIRYAASDDPKALGGANFIIDFKGVRTDG